MNKLLERLDELDRKSRTSDDPWDRIAAGLAFKTEVSNAYPKLRAVVEAANSNLQRWIAGEHSEQDVDLYKALAALEGEE